MGEKKPGYEKDVLRGLQHGINVHGYGFQSASAKYLETEFVSKGSQWSPVQPEFPVTVRNHSTAIGILLHLAAGLDN